MEAEGLLLSRIPLVSMNTTQPPSQLNTFGFNEIHLPSFSVECPWFQWNAPLFFNFWYPQKLWNRRFTVKVSLNTVIKKLKKYVRFYLKPDFSHVWHKIPFWIPKYIISFLSTQWHSFSGLHTTDGGFALNLILWLQRYFWLETLFVLIFGPNIDLTNQLHALPMVKN